MQAELSHAVVVVVVRDWIGLDRILESMNERGKKPRNNTKENC